MSNSLSEKTAAFQWLKSRFDLTSDIQSKVIEITPEIAEKLLLLSVGNRALKKTSVSYLANSIKEGRFVTTNNAIGFNHNLELKDGHHRLSAIKSSGITVKCLVSINIPNDNFRYIDIGVTRTMSDRIELFSDKDFGFKVTGKVSAIANALVNMAVNRSVSGGGTAQQKDNNFMESVIFLNKNGILFVLENCGLSTKLLSNSFILAAIASAYTHVDSQKLSDFCSQFYGGENCRLKGVSNAPYVLRDFLLTAKASEYLRNRQIIRGESIYPYSVQNAISNYEKGIDMKTRNFDGGFFLNKEDGKYNKKPIIYQPIIDFNAYKAAL